MSSGMNIKEAEKIADKMTYREAIMNCLCARCVPYRKATKIKMKRLLECIEAFNLDLDLYTPMHFTPEQKAWVRKYIAINGERQRADAIDDCIQWIVSKFSYIDELNVPRIRCNASTIEINMKEQLMQKGEKNEINKK